MTVEEHGETFSSYFLLPRTREGTQLYLEMNEAGVMENLVMVFGQMNEPAGVRLRVGLTGLTMAEYFRDQGRDTFWACLMAFKFCRCKRCSSLAPPSVQRPCLSRGSPGLKPAMTISGKA